MLRNDNNKLDLDVATMSYQEKKAKGRKCRTLAEAEMDYKKEACFHAKSQVAQLNNLHRKNACDVNECLPIKKCRAKVGLHDGNGNFLFDEKLSVGINSRGNVSQALPVYQQRSIIDLDKYLNQLQADQAPIKSMVIAEAEQNLQAYRNPTNWDGTPTGYTCFCPERPKPCPKKNPCKKPDPFNADIGIGSDALQVKSDLAEMYRAGSVEIQEYELANRERVLQFTQKRMGGGGGGAGNPVDVNDLYDDSLGGLEGRETPSVLGEDSTASATPATTRAVTPLDEIPVARRRRMTRAEMNQAESREVAEFGYSMNSQERANFQQGLRDGKTRDQALPKRIRDLRRTEAKGL